MSITGNSQQPGSSPDIAAKRTSANRDSHIRMTTPLAAASPAHPTMFEGGHYRQHSSHTSLPSFQSLFSFETRKLPEPVLVPQPRSASSSPATFHSQRWHHTERRPSMSQYSVSSPQSAAEARPLSALKHETPPYERMRPATSDSVETRTYRTQSNASQSHPQHVMDNLFTTFITQPRLSHEADNSSKSSTSTAAEPPHVVVKQEVRGKGLCWVYSDGSTMPTVIDGQPVDPELGVTKNFKARKRQTHACQRCREKKTRCELDPSEPNKPCRTCGRLGQECVWLNGTRPGADVKAARGLDKRKGEDAPVSQSTQSMEPDTKKIKLSPSIAHTTPRTQTAKIIDPSFADPATTRELLSLYFRFRDRHCNKVFPEAAFMRWVGESEHKSSADLMLLYACVGLGSVFATSSRLRDAGTEAIARAKELEVAQFGRFSLQLCQARLMLALTQYARGSTEETFEYIATACRALNALHYHTERGCEQDAYDDRIRNTFYMSKSQLIECRRRTFWLAYCMARFTGNATGHTGLLSDKDIFVRVPVADSDYEAGLDTTGPSFEAGFSLEGCGIMAMLIGILSIWEDVASWVFRTSHGAAENYINEYQAFYGSTLERLARWEASLPAHLRASPDNSAANLREHFFAPFYTLAATFHVTHMSLNRYCRYSLLPAAVVQRNILAARSHALDFLKIAITLQRCEVNSDDTNNAMAQFSPGHGLLVACDILGAGGPASIRPKVYEHVGVAHAVMENLSKFTKSGDFQRSKIRDRMLSLGTETMLSAQEHRPCWRFREPLQRSFVPDEFDLIYGVPDEVYHNTVDRL